MSLTTDLTEQKDIKHQTVTGVHWEISPSDRVEPIPNNTISIDFANGYTKGQTDMRAKIEAAIKEIETLHYDLKQHEGTSFEEYNHGEMFGLLETIDIIRKHIGESE